MSETCNASTSFPGPIHWLGGGAGTRLAMRLFKLTQRLMPFTFLVTRHMAILKCVTRLKRSIHLHSLTKLTTTRSVHVCTGNNARGTAFSHS